MSEADFAKLVERIRQIVREEVEQALNAADAQLLADSEQEDEDA